MKRFILFLKKGVSLKALKLLLVAALLGGNITALAQTEAIGTLAAPMGEAVGVKAPFIFLYRTILEALEAECDTSQTKSLIKQKLSLCDDIFRVFNIEGLYATGEEYHVPYIKPAGYELIFSKQKTQGATPLNLGSKTLYLRAGKISNFKLPHNIYRHLDKLDEDTRTHSIYVAIVSDWIGEAIGLKYNEREILFASALFHDIGKQSDEIKYLLRKNGNRSRNLPPDEKYVVKNGHLNNIESALRSYGIDDELIIASVKHHHEHWNGKGYPDKLKGYSIPLFSRIIAFADVLCARTMENRDNASGGNKRIGMKQLLSEEFTEQQGTKYDPNLTLAVIELLYQKVRKYGSEEKLSEALFEEAENLSEVFKEPNRKGLYSGEGLVVWSDFFRNHEEGKYFCDGNMPIYKEHIIDPALCENTGKLKEAIEIFESDKPQSLIIYAEDILKNVMIYDVEQAFKLIKNILKNGKVVLYTQDKKNSEDITRLQALIKNSLGNETEIKILSIDESGDKKEYFLKCPIKELEWIKRKTISKNGQNIFGIIRGNEINEFAVFYKTYNNDSDVPLVIINDNMRGHNIPVFSFQEAVTRIIRARIRNKDAKEKQSWIEILNPIGSISASMYREYINYARHVLSKA